MKKGNSALRRAIFISGTLVAVVAIAYVMCLTRRTLRRYIEEGERIHAEKEAEQANALDDMRQHEERKEGDQEAPEQLKDIEEEKENVMTPKTGVGLKTIKGADIFAFG